MDGSRKQNYTTREPHIATNPLAHLPTHRPNHQPSRTSLPTHDVLQQYSSIRTAGHACVDDMPSSSLCRAGIPIFLRFYATPGSERPVPGNVTFQGPRSPSRSSAPVLLPAPQRAAVWGGRGATARPREAKWSSGVAAVFWV